MFDPDPKFGPRGPKEAYTKEPVPLTDLAQLREPTNASYNNLAKGVNSVQYMNNQISGGVANYGTTIEPGATNYDIYVQGDNNTVNIITPAEKVRINRTGDNITVTTSEHNSSGKGKGRDVSAYVVNNIDNLSHHHLNTTHNSTSDSYNSRYSGDFKPNRSTDPEDPGRHTPISPICKVKKHN